MEKHNNEAIVGDYYKEKMKQLNESGGVNGSSIGFEWFDFHAICRGMKFENVSILMESLGKTLDSFGDTVEVNGQQTSRQSGVLRTNCMDCLDRTNVVQSACGRRALELQLKEVSYSRSKTRSFLRPSHGLGFMRLVSEGETFKQNGRLLTP